MAHVQEIRIAAEIGIIGTLKCDDDEKEYLFVAEEDIQISADDLEYIAECARASKKFYWNTPKESGEL